jgi:acyl-CoA reductase-like NAD-dependent aldehyde dehydrogenase
LEETKLACRWLTDTAGSTLPEEVVEDKASRQVTIRYTPLGVVGAIVPWNFPISLGISPSVKG